MTLHRAPLPVEFLLLWYGTIETLVHRRIEDHEGSGPKRVPSPAYARIASIMASLPTMQCLN